MTGRYLRPLITVEKGPNSRYVRTHEVKHWGDDMANRTNDDVVMAFQKPRNSVRANEIYSKQDYYGIPTELRARDRELSKLFPEYRKNPTRENYRYVNSLLDETVPFLSDYRATFGSLDDLSNVVKYDEWMKALDKYGVKHGLDKFKE
jgi:hypothetical protein